MFNQQRASLELRTANTQISMRSSVKGIQQLHKRIHNVFNIASKSPLLYMYLRVENSSNKYVNRFMDVLKNISIRYLPNLPIKNNTKLYIPIVSHCSNRKRGWYLVYSKDVIY